MIMNLTIVILAFQESGLKRSSVPVAFWFCDLCYFFPGVENCAYGVALVVLFLNAF